MNKIWTLIMMLAIPMTGWTLPVINPIDKSDHLEIPARFSSSSETSVMEWGCPVSEVVEASSGPEALQRISEECMEEARRAANAKPEVFEVIKVSVIWPDVSIIEEGRNGYRLQGTFFLETLVLQGAKGVQK